MSDYQTLQLELNPNEGYAVLTLNRPAQRNTYTRMMGEELVTAFASLRENQAIRVVILTAAGDVFCAGIDLGLLRRHQAGELSDGVLGEEHFIRGFSAELYDFPKPVIAAVNGAAVGIGVTMMLPLDIRIAADSATFALPFARLGILPGLGSSYLLPKLVGMAAAKEWLYSGCTISAAEAVSAGLVSRVVGKDELLDKAKRLAADIAACSPDVIKTLKQLLNQGGMLDSVDDALALERRLSLTLRS